MYIITKEHRFRNTHKGTPWNVYWDVPLETFTFESEQEQHNQFVKMKNDADKSGCGGMCDCFYVVNENVFHHCFGVRVTKTKKLQLKL